MRKTPMEYAELLAEEIPYRPKIAVVLGSGLGGLAQRLENAVAVPYKQLEGFPVSTAPGHKGQFVAGVLGGREVICMQGRLHFYEGHDMADILLPIRTLRCLGVDTLLLTNAAGGINPQFSVGDIMLLEDHINFMGRNPLVGANDDRFGCRFPDMTFAYSPRLRALAEECAARVGVPICKGVYLACSGPSYETPAEIRAFRTLGADAVGMSTVPEVIAANHCGMEVLAFSLISNMAAGILEQPLTEAEVLEAGAKKGAEMQRLICAILEML